MINILIQLAIASIAVFFVHEESGLATAIVVGYLLLAISAIYWLYTNLNQKIGYILNTLKSSESLVNELEVKVDELSKTNEDLVMYSKRHEKWLDGIDSHMPNVDSED